ncbi:MAG: ABC transporter substrate-binding protein [Myxococcota bacterium]
MRRRAWAAVASACLLACPSNKTELDAGSVDAGPAALTEKEPNDRPDQALLLTGSSLVSAHLSADPAKPDEDWYQLSSNLPRTVDVTVSGFPGGDMVLEVMDADRNRLALVNSEGEGLPERLPNLGVSGKTFVRVFAAKRGLGGAYTLTAHFKAMVPGEEVEPNDRAVDGNSLALGEPVTGYLGHAGDEDWYRVELPQPEGAALAQVDGGEGFADAGLPLTDAGAPLDEAPQVALKIELGAVSGVRFEVAVLSEAEAALFQVKGKENEALSLRNVGVRATDRLVYVVVKSGWSGTGKDAKRGYQPDQPYTLSVGQEEAGANAEYEPNDELAKATALPRDGWREGFLSPKSDVDYYVLRTAQPVLAKVQLSGVERLDLVLSVVKPAETPGGAEEVLLKVNDGAVKEPEIANNVLCVEACWFKVDGNTRKVDGKWVRDFENPDLPYRLTVAVTPDDGSQEREPNHRVQDATVLTMSRPVRGTIQPKKDVDYYRLDLSGRPVKTSLRATLTGILKVDVGLYLHRVDEEGKLHLVETADRAKGEQPEVIRYSAEPGVYVFEVRDAKSREANFQDAYQLTVEEGE